MPDLFQILFLLLVIACLLTSGRLRRRRELIVIHCDDTIPRSQDRGNAQQIKNAYRARRLPEPIVIVAPAGIRFTRLD